MESQVQSPEDTKSQHFVQVWSVGVACGIYRPQNKFDSITVEQFNLYPQICFLLSFGGTVCIENVAGRTQKLIELFAQRKVFILCTASLQRQWIIHRGSSRYWINSNTILIKSSTIFLTFFWAAQFIWQVRCSRKHFTTCWEPKTDLRPQLWPQFSPDV